jgi:hypothetical protein
MIDHRRAYPVRSMVAYWSATVRALYGRRTQVERLDWSPLLGMAYQRCGA